MDTCTENATTWDGQLIELYRSNFDSLVRLAHRFAASDGAAEEAVQDAFVKFHARNCRPQPGKELSYLRSMVVNGARAQARRTIRGEELEVRAVHPRGRGIEENSLIRYESEELCDALALLPARQKDVVTLQYVCGLSEREVADRLSISPGSVKTHASRGRSALRRHLSVQRA